MIFKMNKIIILFFVGLLLVSSVSAANWYVDNQATGTGLGTSWGNAALKVSSLDWTKIKGGDTVYISGGTVSKIYQKDQIKDKTISGGIVSVTKGKDSGHNGEVIYSATDTAGPLTNVAFRIYNANNIKVTGLTIMWDTYSDAATERFGVVIVESENIQIDNCHIISNGRANGITVSLSDHISITNNIIEVLDNDYLNNQDGIQISNGAGGNTITGNKIIMRGTRAGPHKDIIQTWEVGSDNNYETIIANNFFSYIAPTAKNAGGVALEDNYGNSYLIYNNIIAVKTVGTNPLTISALNPDANSISVRLFNNTFVTNNSFGILMGDVDTFIMKNNIIWNGNGNQNSLWFHQVGLSAIAYKEIDYNHYYKEGNTHIIYDGYDTPGEISWSAWQTLGYDTHGSNTPIYFKNIWGTNPEDYKLVSSFHPADLNTDGCVSLGEISTYVGRWLNGQITLATVSGGVSKWLGGC